MHEARSQVILHGRWNCAVRATNSHVLCSHTKAEWSSPLLSAIRILIVDDYKDWRRQVMSLFQAQPEWQVVAEASDGQEAIEKAEELKPDLIVLDIGLPKLNGIETARQIRQLSPGSKILFLSQNNDLDVVRAALSAAQGYVQKSDFRVDFLPAIRAVLRGQRFVSSSLKSHEFIDAAADKVPHRHEVQFYSDDAILLEALVRFVDKGLTAGEAVIAIGTSEHLRALEDRLRSFTIGMVTSRLTDAYIAIDAHEALGLFMVNGWPDEELFLEFVMGLVRRASARGRRVRAFGEMVALLWAQGNAAATVHLEYLWNRVCELKSLPLFCAYPKAGFDQGTSAYLAEICAAHSRVI